jgi:hypothetical protein
MKTENKNTHSIDNFQRSEYNPPLDHLKDKVIFKRQLDEAIETIRKYGLPNEIMNKINKKSSAI